MFETDMMQNLQEMQEWRNDWRDLVTPQFKAFLDELSGNVNKSTENESED